MLVEKAPYGFLARSLGMSTIVAPWLVNEAVSAGGGERGFQHPGQLGDLGFDFEETMKVRGGVKTAGAGQTLAEVLGQREEITSVVDPGGDARGRRIRRPRVRHAPELQRICGWRSWWRAEFQLRDVETRVHRKSLDLHGFRQPKPSPRAAKHAHERAQGGHTTPSGATQGGAGQFGAPDSGPAFLRVEVGDHEVRGGSCGGWDQSSASSCAAASRSMKAGSRPASRRGAL